ncbi:MAG: GMC family oxidoreductase [Pseudomonadota bacterium]
MTTARLSDTQRRILTTLADTVTPAISKDDDPDGYWATSASDLGAPLLIEGALLEMPEAQRDALLARLDVLAGAGFAELDQAGREGVIRAASAEDPVAQAELTGLINLILFVTFGAPDARGGANPLWAGMGYPGPRSAPPATPKPITPLIPEGDAMALEADVAVIGSGSGGGVIAGALATRGLNVVVIEAGNYCNEADFNMLEMAAFKQSYWRGGPQTSADLNLSAMAGAGLGGGSQINWTNCLRTPQVVRDEWAAAGLEDVQGDFDRHLDAISERLGINADCSETNPFFDRLRVAADKLGWGWQITQRNVDRAKHDPERAGFIGFGDQTGSKQSTAVTYLRDAFEAGARILVNTRVDTVLTEDGRAAGVAAAYTDPATGRRCDVTVRAPRVVVAAGSFESPAILLRSGIGGPQVGRNLLVHPAVVALGVFDEELKPWWGAPHTFLVDHFEREMEHGFRLEGANFMPGLFASALNWEGGAAHKEMAEKMRRAGPYIARIRGHGGDGHVALNDDGEGQFYYTMTNEEDLETMRLGVASVIRLLATAGAEEIILLGDAPRWRLGEDLDAYIDRVKQIPLGYGGIPVFSAHQMGTCRMGADPATSVADARGELHDTPGVWIGDASGFPTASGTNPMWSVMALAHRTAEHIAETGHNLSARGGVAAA